MALLGQKWDDITLMDVTMAAAWGPPYIEQRDSEQDRGRPRHCCGSHFEGRQGLGHSECLRRRAEGLSSPGQCSLGLMSPSHAPLSRLFVV